MKKRIVAVLAIAILWGGQSLAQSTTPISNSELSKELDNPVSRVITLPLRYEAEFDNGAYEATKDTLEIDQALVPFRLSEDWSLITRTKLPVEALPPSKVGNSWASASAMATRPSFCRPSTATNSTGASGRCSTIRPRRQRSGSTNGAQARRWPS